MKVIKYSEDIPRKGGTMNTMLLREEDAEMTLGEFLKEELFPDRSATLFGIPVNPSFVTAFWLTVGLIVLALVFRFLVYPHFKQDVPGKFQCLVEKAVEAVERFMADKSPHSNVLIGMVSFAACFYIGLGSLCEIIGIRAILVDINACIAVAIVGYGTMLIGGIYGNRFKGAMGVLKDFSMLLSMSFRLFGAMIGGLVMTELVYYFPMMRWGTPVLVGVLFTVLHALVQSYVFMTLVAMFYGEAVEPRFLNGTSVRQKKIKLSKKSKQGA